MRTNAKAKIAVNLQFFFIIAQGLRQFCFRYVSSSGTSVHTESGKITDIKRSRLLSGILFNQHLWGYFILLQFHKFRFIFCQPVSAFQAP